MKQPFLARLALLSAASVGLLWQSTVQAQDGAAPAPPSDLVATDHGWDGGDRLDLAWTLSPDDPRTDGDVAEGEAAPEEDGDVLFYKVYQAVVSEDGEAGAFELIDTIPAGDGNYVVKDLDQDGAYLYRVAAVSRTGAESAFVATAVPLSPSVQWFEGERFWLFVLTVIFGGSVIYWIYHARTGKPINVRKIAGLEAVDEAVGRATEMGRPCLFIPGIQDINEIQTIAGLTILSRVSKTAAEYDAKVEVPTSRSLVMTTARETVQAAYLSAGRPDAYNEDLIYYVTDEQFGYVAYLQGHMVREKPAACFYMGAFFAESLILAETGNSVGAIQVAGTAMPAQLPFFVAACDYTLIGEEFFAASAYLSGSPEELGSLKGQDVGKAIVAVLVVIGVLLATVAVLTDSAQLQEIVTWIKESLLT
jgi:hypothetical protein